MSTLGSTLVTGYRPFFHFWHRYSIWQTPRLQRHSKGSSSVAIMSDRYFKNDLADYDASINQLFPTPQDFLAAGINLKNEIVQATWSRRRSKVQDPTLYTGVLGTAFLCFKSYEVAGSKEDLSLCLEIVESCAVAAVSMKAYVTFIAGRAGIYALGGAAAKYAEDSGKMHHYLKLLREMAREKAFVGDFGMPNELLYGRAGFLWACLFVNKHVGEEAVSWSLLGPIVGTTVAAGRAGAGACHTQCPLMYEWHGTRYWGAAHGLAGIMHLLMHFPLNKDAEDVRRTMCYMVGNCFPSGNYPSAEGDAEDRLVHWCHGAPGVVLTLCKAAQVFPSDARLQEAAVDAGEVVWRRGLLRRVGICHGVSGNTYTFLALHRLTGDERHLHRAKAFSKFLFEHGRNLVSSGEMHGGDRPYSLFEGLAGTACLFLDMARPEDARFPCYEL